MLNFRPQTWNPHAKMFMPGRVREPRRVVLERLSKLDTQTVHSVPAGKKTKGRRNVLVDIKRFGLIDYSRYNGAALREIRKTHR